MKTAPARTKAYLDRHAKRRGLDAPHLAFKVVVQGIGRRSLHPPHYRARLAYVPGFNRARYANGHVLPLFCRPRPTMGPRQKAGIFVFLDRYQADAYAEALQQSGQAAVVLTCWAWPLDVLSLARRGSGACYRQVRVTRPAWRRALEERP